MHSEAAAVAMESNRASSTTGSVKGAPPDSIMEDYKAVGGFRLTTRVPLFAPTTKNDLFYLGFLGRKLQ